MAARILVVEDDPTNRALVTKFLRHLGYELVEAASGAAALQLARSAAVDLILLDLGLPEVDGHEVARQLKRNPSTAGIPLVALTAYALRGDDRRATAAGCDYYLPKPFDLDALSGLIREALGTAALGGQGLGHSVPSQS